ncbi:hypothetical protein CF327_g5969 [Tilletia walkeri]|nr:hypothetical protein CF327_g5969 [Tilletia walkeri]
MDADQVDLNIICSQFRNLFGPLWTSTPKMRSIFWHLLLLAFFPFQIAFLLLVWLDNHGEQVEDKGWSIKWRRIFVVGMSILLGLLLNVLLHIMPDAYFPYNWFWAVRGAGLPFSTHERKFIVACINFVFTVVLAGFWLQPRQNSINKVIVFLGLFGQVEQRPEAILPQSNQDSFNSSYDHSRADQGSAASSFDGTADLTIVTVTGTSSPGHVFENQLVRHRAVQETR